MDAHKVMEGLNGSRDRLKGLGHEARILLTRDAATVDAQVSEALRESRAHAGCFADPVDRGGVFSNDRWYPGRSVRTLTKGRLLLDTVEKLGDSAALIPSVAFLTD
jgi:hypothetical protein